MGVVSANDVRSVARTALADSPISELRELQVEESDSGLVIGGLVIDGVVSTFYHKQLAQEAVRVACGGFDVEVTNSIRVRSVR